MSSEHAIVVSCLSKCFHIYDTPRDRLLQMLARGRRQYYREFWAMRDVSFTIGKGETVGIVGRNGSGKSTLLQLICGTLNPTGGEVQTHGRIAALLELGSGFNPEFSGRENVYMNAAVLGLSREETEARFAEIEAFAEIGEFIDQPVKTYSSGMMVRLAFAVAINVDAQVLIVDEALAVGDELFQRKCYARIEALKQKGATILFVSHSGGTVIELCDRALLLDRGELLLDGQPKQVVGQYQKLLYSPSDRLEELKAEIRTRRHTGIVSDPQPPKDGSAPGPLPSDAGGASAEPDAGDETFYDPGLQSSSVISYESHGALIGNPRIYDRQGRQVNNLKRGQEYRYTYQVDFTRRAIGVRFGMMIKTLAGVELGGATSAAQLQDSVTRVDGGSRLQVEFVFQCNLNPGTYFLNAGVLGMAGETETYLHRLVDACLFRVLPVMDNLSTGTVDFKCRATHTELAETV